MNATLAPIRFCDNDISCDCPACDLYWFQESVIELNLLFDEIGSNGYFAWKEANIMMDNNWHEIYNKATQKREAIRLDAECNCNGYNRDGCAECAPTGTEIPYQEG